MSALLANVRRATVRHDPAESKIALRVEPELRDRLEAAAELDRRPMANLIRAVLADWIERQAQGGRSGDRREIMPMPINNLSPTGAALGLGRIPGLGGALGNQVGDETEEERTGRHWFLSQRSKHMMSLTPPLPPSVPSDAAILGAMALLAALGNAANSQATLDTMATAKREIDQAISANNAALREATEAQAALSDLEARAQDVASREAALAAAQTQLSVASAAVKERERGLTSRAAELDQRETELAAREKSLADRVEAYRRALA